MRILGVTGGSGTGKTTVCNILENKGGKIIDADLIARSLQKKGCIVYNEIVDFFGDSILNSSCELDRTKLADIVFKDKDKLKKLNLIVHKRVSLEIKRLIEAYDVLNEKFIVLDVPIPVEEGFFDSVHRIWVIIAKDELRIKRIQNRMGISQEQAIERLSCQMTNTEYSDIADVVIENNVDFNTLEKIIEEELDDFLKGEFIDG